MPRPTWDQGKLVCSFCNKSQDKVGKLISNPHDYPRAYICDECIAVCASIIEDDRGVPLFHSLAPQFFSLVEEWIGRHDRGEDVTEVLDQMLTLGRQIVAPEKNEPIRFEPGTPI